MKLRIGLFGLGEGWEKRYRPALRTLTDRFEVRAVCDQVAHRAELAASELGAEAVDSYGVLVAREDVDAILVLYAQWFGTLPVLAACNAGKAVYLGTGLDISLQEARQIRDRVLESGITLMVELPRRQSPATLRLKELMATRLGRPQLIYCHHRLPVLDANDCSNRHSVCRTVAQELVELVDWCCYVVGEQPRWVTGTMYGVGATARQTQYQMMSLDFSEGSSPGAGPIAQISCGRYIPGRWIEALSYRPLAALQVSCEHGIAFVDLPSTLIWFDEAGRHQESLESERPVGEQMLMQFYRAVTSLVSKTCNLEDACRALEIVEEAGNSYREGRRIALWKSPVGAR
jgi:predicted dehydrogenase